MDNFANEIAYGVLTCYSGMGIGTEIVRYALLESNALLLFAWVSEQNIASVRCFEKNGFRNIGNGEERHLSRISETHIFRMWVKEVI